MQAQLLLTKGPLLTCEVEQEALTSLCVKGGPEGGFAFVPAVTLLHSRAFYKTAPSPLCVRGLLSILCNISDLDLGWLLGYCTVTVTNKHIGFGVRNLNHLRSLLVEPSGQLTFVA